MSGINKSMELITATIILMPILVGALFLQEGYIVAAADFTADQTGGYAEAGAGSIALFSEGSEFGKMTDSGYRDSVEKYDDGYCGIRTIEGLDEDQEVRLKPHINKDCTDPDSEIRTVLILEENDQESLKQLEIGVKQ